MNLKPSQMVALYVKCRDELKVRNDAHKQSVQKIVDVMTKLEGLMLEHLNQTGADSLASPAGTVYKRTETSCTVEDKTAFEEWARDQDSWDALDVKANKTAVKALIDAGKPLPPGVKVTQVALVGVRRS